MSNNPSDPIIRADIMRNWAEEQLVGDRYDAESLRAREVGIKREVNVEVFRRNQGPEIGTYFLRVSLRCRIKPTMVTQHNQDFDRYGSMEDFMRMVHIGGGAAAEHANMMRGNNFDPDYIGKVAVEAARELLMDIKQQE